MQLVALDFKSMGFLLKICWSIEEGKVEMEKKSGALAGLSAGDSLFSIA